MGLMDRQRAHMAKSQHNTSVGRIHLINGRIQDGIRRKWSVLECSAELIEAGPDGQRVTTTRVAAGAVLAGPVGALIGGMARKGTGSGWLIVRTPDGELREKVKGSKVAKARELVMNLRLEQERQRGTSEV